MDSSPLLSVEEAAKLLKMSKYTLYELIKRGEIPAQRIGRQLRLDPDKLFKRDFAPITSPFPEREPLSPLAGDRSGLTKENDPLHSLVFIGSHEPIINLLADFWKHSSSPWELSLTFKGSMEGLIALYRREAQLSGIHLWDEQTQEYNTPYIPRILPSEKITLINLVQRVQGFILQPGNPLSIQGIEDLTRKGVRFINRQKGSGTRIRFDSLLRAAGIESDGIRGYSHEVMTHRGVAGCVANDQADVGIGIQSEAHHMGLDFLPLFEERYDLVCLQSLIPEKAWLNLRQILNSSTFHKAINRQVGYNSALTGKITAQF